MLQETLALFRIGLVHPDLLRMVRQIKLSHKSFLTYQQILSLTENYRRLVRRGQRDIQVAEFGVGRGGSAMVLSWLVNKYGGTLFLFDVFSRIPPPSATDGEQAKKRYQAILDHENGDYYGNIPDLMDVIREEISWFCPLERVKFIQGRYEEVLPEIVERNSFQLIHIDCDWYESAKAVLAYLERNLSSGAILQIDDYYYWQGAHQATNEASWLANYPRRKVGGAAVIDTGGPSKTQLISQ